MGNGFRFRLNRVVNLFRFVIHVFRMLDVRMWHAATNASEFAAGEGKLPAALFTVG